MVKKGKYGVGQTNMMYGWALSTVYWSTGALVGYKSGFLTQEAIRIPISMELIGLYAIAAMITSVCVYIMGTRNDSFGRPVNPPVVVVFALLNGILETFLFLACYDWGCSLYGGVGSSSYGPMAVGFSVYCLYAGAIHALWWLPLVLPPHMREDAPPFHLHGLPALMAMSVAWLVVYKVTGGSVTVSCLLHIGLDAILCIEIGMPGPFSSAIVDTKESPDSTVSQRLSSSLTTPLIEAPSAPTVAVSY
jgi:hypothetical protein